MTATSQKKTVISIPGPSPMPILGWRGNRLKFAFDRITSITNLYKTYGSVVAMVRNDSRRVFAFGPSYNKLILTNTEIFHTTPFLKVPSGSALERLSKGLFTMNGEEHRQQKQLLMPAFHKQYLANYHSDIVNETEIILQKWNNIETVGLVENIRQLVLSIMNKTLFGIKESNSNFDLAKQFRDWLQQLTSPWSIVFPIENRGTPYYRLLKSTESLEKSILKFIKNKENSNHLDVITILLQAKDEHGIGFTPEELVGQITTLFLASYETVTNALTWTIVLLSQHPRIRNELTEEIRDSLGTAHPTLDNVSNLTLLNQVIKESLRLLPPAPYSHRKAIHSFELDSYSLPENSVVTYSPYITHRIPDIYSMPQSFIPSRWDTIKPHAYEYLPFGAGPRMCIGAGFATMQLSVILSMILQRYQLDLAPNTSIDHQVLISLGPKNEVNMRISKSTHNKVVVPVKGTLRNIVDFPDN